ncbi:hypothetical protein [Oceanisphaera sp. KMM 10153]|uniref:hypothetical protein n=1 Tax=Oceanisphaera submarina TaxID=3390193 RepID=UPI0039753F54
MVEDDGFIEELSQPDEQPPLLQRKENSQHTVIKGFIEEGGIMRRTCIDKAFRKASSFKAMRRAQLSLKAKEMKRRQ